MNHPEYRHTPQSPERRAAASAREKARWRQRTALPDRSDWRGPIVEPDDFARCSPERQRRVMEAIHHCLVLYQEPWAGGEKRQELLAMMLAEWVTMTSVVARQAAQHLEANSRTTSEGR